MIRSMPFFPLSFRCFVLLLLLVSATTVSSQTGFKAHDLVGEWEVSEKTAVITFFADGHKYFGMTSWMKKPKDENGNMRTDIHNPDPALRSRHLLGLLLCQNFIYKGEGVWTDGTIYDSRSGKTYNCKITMKDHNTINVRGYIGISLIGGSTTFTRKQK